MAFSKRRTGKGGEEEQNVVTQKQAYINEANQVTDKSRDATRRMVALVEESKAVGIDTMDELVRQGEQLDRVENQLDDIAFGVKKSEKHLEEMNKCCGLFTPPWKRWKKFDRTTAYKDAFDEKRVAKRDKEAVKEAERAAAVFGGGGGGGRGGAVTAPSSGTYVQRVMNNAAEDEMEGNLQQVSTGLEMLKGMALDFGTTIDKQNAQIENITVKGEANEIGIAQNQHRMDRMLKGM